MAGPMYDPVQAAFDPALRERVWQQRAMEESLARAANPGVRGRTGGEVAGDVGLQLLQGAVGVGQALYGAGNIATLGVMDRLLGMSTNFDETNKTIESWKSDPTQAAKARASEAFDSSVWEGVKEYATTPSLLQDLIVPNIASLIPAGAGAQFASRTAQGAGAIAKHATRGAAIAGGIQAGGAADVDTINAARAAGMTEGEAQAAGLGAGVATGVMTPVVSMVTGGAQLKGAVAARLLGRTQAAAATGRGVVNAALGGVAKEAGEESIQSGLETVIQNVATGEDAMAGAAQSAVLGGLAGGVLGGGMGVYAGPRKATPLRSTVSAEVKASAEAAGVPAAASGLAPTVAESQQVSDALAAVQPKEGDPLDVQRAIDYRMSAKLAGMKEKDLISTEELVKSQLFTEQPDGTLTRWNSDLQRNEEVPKEQVDAAVKEATSWKEFAVKDLGLRPSDLHGKAWKAFTDAANGAGVMPISETAGDFLASYAGGITPGAELTKFDTRLSEKYAPPVDDVPVAVPPPPVRNPLDVQRAIDYRMSAKLAGTRERDLLSVEELAKRQLFAEQPDGTLTRWNSDLQRTEEVPKEQVDAAVKAATSWKEFAVKDLGLRPSDLQGKAWKEFTDAAKAADVVPISDAAGEFLSAYAGGVDPGANLSKFAMRLSEKYSPAVEDIPVTATMPPVLMPEAEALPGKVVWHGSPHTFDKFSTERIGSGEGTQAYGQGLYFTDKQGIAKHYKKALSLRAMVDVARDSYDEFDNPDDATRAMASNESLTPQQRELLAALGEDDWLGFDYPHQAVDAALNSPGAYELSDRTKQAVDALGKLFKVSIPNDGVLLGRDSPVSEQPPNVVKALKGAVAQGVIDASVLSDDTLGSGVYAALSKSLGGEKQASAFLNSVGVRGLKYLDGVSRKMTKEQRAEKGESYNYVVFDDASIGTLPGESATEPTVPVTEPTVPVPKAPSEVAQAIAAMRKNKKEPVVVDVTPAKGDWNDAGGVTTLHYGGDGGVFGDSGASEFTMGRMDKDDHTYVDGGNTVSFYKDPETDLWHWQNKGVGAFGVFDAPTRADAKRSIEMVVDERAASWDAMRAAQGMTDLNEGITRNKFVEEQFDEELDSAMRLAAEDEDETAHGAFLDHVQQTFDSTGATEALRKTKDYAIAKAKEKFSSGDDALTPAGLNKLVGDIARSYTDRHDNIVSKIGGSSVYVDDAVFSRTGAKDGTPTHATLPMMHMEQVQRVVDFANTNRSNTETPVQVFPTVQAFLDAHDMQGVPADTKGVYLGDGTVALVAENIKDAEDAARTILHERTHEGLSGLLGDNLSVVTNRLWANAAMRTRIKGKMEELGLSRSVAAEEVLTDMQQNNERLTRDVWSKVKTGIKKAFDVLLGSDQIVVSDADVDALLDDVVKYRAKGVSTPSSRMTSAEAMKHVDNMMDGVPDTVNAARFSRALEELEKITGDSDEAPAESTSSILSGVAKDTTKYVGGLMSALRKGNFGTLPRQLYRVVGVPQLHKTFRSMWDATTEDGDKDNAYDRFAGHFSDHTDERNRVQHSVGNITRELDSMRRSKPAMAKKFNALVQYSTFFQINPGNEVQPDAPGIDAEERSKAQAMIGSLWKQVGAEGQKLFGDMQAAYSRVIRDEYAAVKQTLADAKGINLDTASALELSKFNEEFGGMLDAQLRLVGRFPYSPLKRFGKFMVDIRDGEGKQVEFTGHDTEAEALKFASDQRARFGSALTVSTMLRSEFRMDMDGLNHNMLEKIRAGVALMYPESAVLKTMSADEQAEVEDRNERYEEMRGVTERVLVDVYLRSIPDHSIMNRLNARKYVAGFPLDASRAFNSYMIGAAGHIANVKYSAAMSRDLSDMAAVVRQKGLGNDDGIKMMNVLNAVRGQYSGRKDVEPNPIASMLTTASFVWMMSSPSQMIVNALQTPLVAAPRMFAQFGVKGTIDSLSSAAAQWFKTGGILGDPSINPMVKKVLEEMQQTGMEDFTLASTMSGLAAGQSSDMHTAWRTILKVASYGMHKSEVFNRQITAHAYATQMLKKNPGASYDELLASTKDFIDTQSHFNYDPQNSPEVMQGPWRKAILQFQNYRLNMLALLARDIKTAEFGRMLTGKDALDPETAKLARATLAYTVGTQLALTGAAGTVVAPAVFAIMDAFRDDDDLLDSRTAFVQAAPRILAHGALSVLPLLNIDPSRVGTGGILPILGDRHYAPKDKSAAEEFDYHAVKMLGPSAALAKRMWDGSRDIYNGDFKEALKKMLPGPLVSVYTAAVDFDGMRDKRGVQFYDPTLADTIKTAIGLKSGDILAANEKRSAAYQAETHVSALSKRALTKVALGYNLGDSDLQQEGTDQFMGLVNAYPGMVNAKMLRRTIAGATKAQYNADMYGVSKAGKLSQEVLAAIGE